MGYLEVNNLTKSFKGREVLQPLSFSLEQGESLVIIGDSGSGKTTLLRMLCFLETPDSGSITLEGASLFAENRKLKSQEKAARRAHFGLVFQGFYLFPQYDVFTNIALPLKLAKKKELKDQFASLPFFKRRQAFKEAWKKTEVEIEKRVEDLLEEFHLSAVRKSYPYSLSGGESQRVAIARALALDPEILCFDEPTSALDPRLKNEVASLIVDLKKQGRTLIIVTHEIAFARAVADRLIFLEDGMIKEQGSAAILVSPKSEALQDFLSQEKKEETDERRPQDQKEGTR